MRVDNYPKQRCKRIFRCLNSTWDFIPTFFCLFMLPINIALGACVGQGVRRILGSVALDSCMKLVLSDLAWGKVYTAKMISICHLRKDGAGAEMQSIRLAASFAPGSPRPRSRHDPSHDFSGRADFMHFFPLFEKDV